MAVQVPTLDDFLTRFPSFESMDPDLLQALIDEASRQVDDSWAVADQKIAIMYLAAHLAATEPVDGASAATPAVASESIRGMSVSYFTGGDMTGLGSTEYGRRFLALFQSNVGDAILVVGGGPRCA